MQRNSTYQTVILGFAYFVAYIGYVGLSSIYLFLPPLFGILFIHFIRAVDRGRFDYLILIALMLMLFEVEKDFLLISSLVFFGLMYHFAVPRFRQYFNCLWCLDLIYIASAYIGYWLFLMLISNIFWMNTPAIDWHVLLYILLEFILVSSL
jgi:hypothetical protein